VEGCTEGGGDKTYLKDCWDKFQCDVDLFQGVFVRYFSYLDIKFKNKVYIFLNFLTNAIN
jgi:hypothetical protein